MGRTSDDAEQVVRIISSQMRAKLAQMRKETVAVTRRKRTTRKAATRLQRGRSIEDSNLNT